MKRRAPITPAQRHTATRRGALADRLTAAADGIDHDPATLARDLAREALTFDPAVLSELEELAEAVLGSFRQQGESCDGERGLCVTFSFPLINKDLRHE